MTIRNEHGSPSTMTKQEFAEELRVSTRTVERYIADGTIDARKVGKAGLVRIDRSQLIKVTN